LVGVELSVCLRVRPGANSGCPPGMSRFRAVNVKGYKQIQEASCSSVLWQRVVV
jgi:hypothetical protein